MLRSLLATATVLGTAAGITVAVPGTAVSDTCSVRWGSLSKSVTNNTHTRLVGLRTGRHACFDRLVLDLTSPGAGYRVRYVDAVRDQGRGAIVPLRGGAFLQVDSQSMAVTRPTMPSVAGYRTFRQLGYGGSFEGYSTVGLGVRARLPFRVFASGPDLVVDVAHHW